MSLMPAGASYKQRTAMLKTANINGDTQLRCVPDSLTRGNLKLNSKTEIITDSGH
jgi:hypothetical protein